MAFLGNTPSQGVHIETPSKNNLLYHHGRWVYRCSNGGRPVSILLLKMVYKWSISWRQFINLQKADAYSTCIYMYMYLAVLPPPSSTSPPEEEETCSPSMDIKHCWKPFDYSWWLYIYYVLEHCIEVKWLQVHVHVPPDAVWWQ